MNKNQRKRLRKQALNGNAAVSERQETTSVKDSPLERPPGDISSKSDLDLAQCDEKSSSSNGKKKRKRPRRKQKATPVKSPVDICVNKDLETAKQDAPLSLRQIKKRKKRENRDAALGTDLSLPRATNTCLKMNESNAEVSLNETENKLKVNEESYDAQSRSIKENNESSIVSSCHSKSSTTCSTMRGDRTKVPVIPSDDIKTYQRRKKARIKTYQRKRRKLSNSLGRSLKPLEEDAIGSLMQVQQSNSVVEASINCANGQPASEESKRRLKVNNSKETGDEGSCMENVSVLNIAEEQCAKQKTGNLDIVVQSGLHMGKILNEPLLAGSDARKDVSGLVIGDNPLQVSLSSPERPLIVPSKKKLLILDVNGLLADIVSSYSDGYRPDIMISGKAVFMRPFCDNFLRFCFETFHVGVWSSRIKRNVERLLDFLFGSSKDKLLFCWDQSHCTHTGFKTIENEDKPLVLKELKKLWEKQEPDLPWERGEYNESNTLLLDDSPYKALRNPAYTAIFPATYQYNDDEDCSLGRGGDLRVYLEKLAAAENVQEYVKQNPFGQRPITELNVSWGFYRRIVDTSCCQPNDEPVKCHSS